MHLPLLELGMTREYLYVSMYKARFTKNNHILLKDALQYKSKLWRTHWRENVSFSYL